MAFRLLRHRIGPLLCASLAFLVIVAPEPCAAAPNATNYVRGVLLVGKFRSQTDLNQMTEEDWRNTLIVELANRTRNDVPFYQGLSSPDLAGVGSLLVFLREAKRRSDAEIKAMSADDLRNTVIVEAASQTGQSVPSLQAMSNMRLVQLVLGPERAWIRGVLLVGKFRSQIELNGTSGEDQRNTLIVELANRTKASVADYQGLNDADLAGVGALLVYLRGAGRRTDAELKGMSPDDLRNTVIVEVHEQTSRADLQALSNIQLARMLLGSVEIPEVANLPEPWRPGTHTLVLRTNRWATSKTIRSFSDVPFLGTFIGRGTDCTHGASAPADGAGTNQDFIARAGWGQIEGDGHPGSNSDQCVSWIQRVAFDFDATPFTSIPVRKSLDRAVLRYGESAASSCMALVYTQGGYLVDSLPCWTNGEGEPEPKPGGCLALKVPDEDWTTQPTGERTLALNPMSFNQTGPAAWDVTGLFNSRVNPGLGQGPTGWGYVLVGTPLDTSQLDANDNTRYTSFVSDVRLEVAYTVPPIQPTYDLPPVH
jgi:hypothetical protein